MINHYIWTIMNYDELWLIINHYYLRLDEVINFISWRPSPVPSPALISPHRGSRPRRRSRVAWRCAAAASLRCSWSAGSWTKRSVRRGAGGVSPRRSTLGGFKDVFIFPRWYLLVENQWYLLVENSMIILRNRLVVTGTMEFDLTFHIGNFIIPTDELHDFSGW